jgi:protein O-GlcNAc transferase
VDDKAGLLRTARDELVQGRAAEAREIYQRLLADDQRDAEALLGLVRVALYTGDYPLARQLAERALGLRAGHLETEVLRAVAIEAQGDLAAAVELVRTLAQSNPGSCLANYHAGRLLAAVGQCDQALPYLERATQFEGQHHERQHYEITNLIGYVLQRLGRYDEAARVHRRALLMAPEKMDAYLGLGDALVARGELDGALTVLTQARRSAGEHPDLLKKLGRLLAAKGNAKGALQLAQRLCELEPGNAGAWLDVASFCLVVKDMQASERAALRARELAPQSWQPHFHLGLVYDAWARPAKAEAAYRQAVERQPDSWEPANNLGLVLLGKGLPEAAAEAETLFRRAIELGGPEPLGPCVNLALALGRQGKDRACVEACGELLGRALPEPVRQRLRALKREHGG